MKSKLFNMIMLISLLAFVFPESFSTAAAANPAKVLILPFNIHSQEDLSFLKNGIVDMLSTRLTIEGRAMPISREETEKVTEGMSGPVNEQSAASLGQQFGADYVLYGSLTVFGESISTDARFFDMGQGKAVVTFYESGKNQSDVIEHVNRFAEQVSEKVFSRVSLAARPAKPAPPVAESRKHPDAMWAEDKTRTKPVLPAPPSPAAAVAAPVITALAASAAPVIMAPERTQADMPGTIWKSRTFRAQIRGMAVGDVDGDGSNEIAFISDKDVSIFRYTGGRLGKLGEVSGKGFYNLISLDIADINQNGRAEIFVTNVNKKSIQSFVVEWDGTRFRKIVENAKWYYRVLDVPGKGKVLLGQKRGMKEPFVPGIYTLGWSNNQYLSEKRQAVPKSTNVYGFIYGDVLNKGREEILAFSKSDHIRILNPGGEEEWKSNDPYGGGATYLEFPAEASARIGGDKEMDFFYLPMRIILKDLDKDGKNEVLVGNNADRTRRVFSRFRSFKSGQIECLVWDKMGLYQKWRTREISGYISDYAIADVDNDGQDELVFSVVEKHSSALGKAKSFIASQDFPSGS